MEFAVRCVSRIHVTPRSEEPRGRAHTHLSRREQVREGGYLERGRCSGSPSANTLGRLRIMMTYCIQIRIPTVRAALYGHRHREIALYRGNARHRRATRTASAPISPEGRSGKPRRPIVRLERRAFLF